MTLALLVIAFVYTIALGLLRLHDTLSDPTRYRHPMHRRDPRRPTVPDDWTPLPDWVRAGIRASVHSRLAIGAGA